MVPVEHLFYLSAFLFSMGLLIVIVKRNAILMLAGIELMLNGANVNLVAFDALSPSLSQGKFFALFVIIVAVCEAAIGLALVLRVYRYYAGIIPNQFSELKG